VTNIFKDSKLKKHGLVTNSSDRELTGPTISDTWDTVVPEAAPRYSTRVPGAYIMNKFSVANMLKNIVRTLVKQINLQSRCCRHHQAQQQPAWNGRGSTPCIQPLSHPHSVGVSCTTESGTIII